MAPELQEDLLGTKVKKVLLVFTYISDPHLDLVPQVILVTAPELQEDGDGTITGNVSISDPK